MNCKKVLLFFFLAVIFLGRSFDSYPFSITKLFEQKSDGHAKIVSLNKKGIRRDFIKNFTGNLTTENVEQIIFDLIETRRVSNSENFQKFNVKELSEGGIFSGQIFKVSGVGLDGTEKNLWILKGVKKGLNELDNLDAVDRDVIIPFKRYQKNNFDYYQNSSRIHLPVITRSIINFSIDVNYEKVISNKDKILPIYYFSLLEIADGKSFSKWIIDLADVYSDHPEEKEIVVGNLKHIFKELGHQMAHLYFVLQDKPKEGKIFGRTKIHGDFHGDNVYASVVKGGNVQISLIDNESFSFRKTYGVKDLVDLYVLTSYKTLAHHYSTKLLRYKALYIPPKIWYKLWKRAFTSYGKTYAKLSGVNIHDAEIELSKVIKDLMSAKKFANIKNLKDQRYLKLMKMPGIKNHREKKRIAKLLDEMSYIND